MAEGRFIQAGPGAPATSNDGYGQFITVGRLEQLERERTRATIDRHSAEMFAEGVRVMRAKLDADQAIEKMRVRLHNVVGPNGVRVSFAMMSDEAARQSSQQAAHDAARAKAQPVAQKK